MRAPRTACGHMLEVDMPSVCPGHAGMEAAIANLLEPGQKVVVGNKGIWGARVADLCSRYGGAARAPAHGCRCTPLAALLAADVMCKALLSVRRAQVGSARTGTGRRMHVGGHAQQMYVMVAPQQPGTTQLVGGGSSAMMFHMTATRSWRLVSLGRVVCRRCGRAEEGGGQDLRPEGAHHSAGGAQTRAAVPLPGGEQHRRAPEPRSE
jgi:hypothetical protein